MHILLRLTKSYRKIGTKGNGEALLSKGICLSSPVKELCYLVIKISVEQSSHRYSFRRKTMAGLIQKVETSFLCFYLATALAAADLSSEYNHVAYLDPNENYKLYWSVKDADKSIHFATEVKTTGWVGFGISVGLTGSMKNADIVVGWVDSNGKPHLEVRHSFPLWITF